MPYGNLYRESVKRQFGSDAVVKPERRVGVTVEITCSGGRSGASHRVMVSGGPFLPPEAINRHLCQRGWRMGRVITCPACVEAEKHG